LTKITLECDPVELFECLKENGDTSIEIVGVVILALLLGKKIEMRDRLRLSMLKIVVK